MYDVKSNEYFTHVRRDIVDSLNGSTYNNVLELGAGGCDTLLYLKEKGIAKKVTGVELFEIENSNQQNPKIDAIHIASIEKLNDLPISTNKYDLIICGDILEHVFDPWAVLKDVRNLLQPGGVIVCSIPNFREFATMRKIFFQGDFKYNPEGGILDKTHIRFFCKKNIVSLFTDAGLRIKAIDPTFKWATSQNKRKTINRITFGLFEEFFAFQYLVHATSDQS